MLYQNVKTSTFKDAGWFSTLIIRIDYITNFNKLDYSEFTNWVVFTLKVWYHVSQSVSTVVSPPT